MSPVTSETPVYAEFRRLSSSDAEFRRLSSTDAEFRRLPSIDDAMTAIENATSQRHNLERRILVDSAFLNLILMSFS